MAQSLDFQSIILRLQNFWAEHGCIIWQPYHTEVGAGTMNPATYLRVLGPEPWNVAYVEPSIRPDDGRYGENPNRLQQHHQYQVILKPDPGNPQELYLQSLQALGLDPRQHDIRFIEDNWESPALGAWGLGWEVWLNGMEITQFTYFQQAGGFVLEPVSVELTYGLERIAMALQGVHDFRNIQWNTSYQGSAAYTYGDVNLQGEYEHSKYFFEVADVNSMRQNYRNYVHEANASLSNELVLPAHDYVLKCSHLFNVLDTRGAIGVTERQALFAEMRDLAHRVAEAYLQQREKMGYPWLQRGKQSIGLPALPNPPAAPSSPQSFLFEIGTEELPSADLSSVLTQLKERVPAFLNELRLSYGEVHIYATPRRLVAYIKALAAQQADLEQVVKGPPAERAFDAQGNPTQAAQGFARSKGIDVSALQVRDMDGGRYVTALIFEKGRPTPQLLAENLATFIASLRFDKSMRWNASNVAFSRPIRWLLALYGSDVIPFTYADLQSSNRTRGLRFYEPEEFAVVSPDAYFSKLKEQGIILDVQERQEAIYSKMAQAVEKLAARVAQDATLLEEVTNEVEAVTTLVGSFDKKSLELPHEVLVAVMKKHQRYFPLEAIDKEGQMLAYFIALRNGDGCGIDFVRSGNEDVIRARFADAAFFINEDKKLSLTDHLPKCATLTFQKELGSMLDKSQRIEKLIADLAPRLGLSAEDTKATLRAATLSKGELVTKMVIEMTSLQGVIGRYYALNDGEPQAVAEALFEQYLPRFAGDALTKTKPGLVLGLADRLDTLSGLFSVGLAPSGTKDPFAQRRAALGIVQNLIAWDMDFDISEGLHLSAEKLPVSAAEQRLTECLTFIIERLRNMLLEQGFRYDVVEAVLSIQGRNPAKSMRAIKELSEWISREDWQSTIFPAYARCARITRALKERYPVSEHILREPAERALFNAVQEGSLVMKEKSVNGMLNAILHILPCITRFFDDVLVMAEDTATRQNRLGLLQTIVAMSEGIADLSKLEGF